jgi:hypothetical protein
MSRQLETCRCSRGEPSCGDPATQEDFLCDICRAGCARTRVGPCDDHFDCAVFKVHMPPPILKRARLS